jgi:hypothetical protein
VAPGTTSAHHISQRLRLFIGIGLNITDHTDVRPTDPGASATSEYVDYSETHQFATSHQSTVFGPRILSRPDIADWPNDVQYRRWDAGRRPCLGFQHSKSGCQFILMFFVRRADRRGRLRD